MNNATKTIIAELTAAYARYSLSESPSDYMVLRYEASITYWETRLAAAKAEDLANA